MNNALHLYKAAGLILLASFLSCKNSPKPEVNPAPAPAHQSWYISPIPAIGVGPNGMPEKRIDVNPYCCPSTAIEVTPSSNANGNDPLQYVNIPLTVPNGKINSVSFCYQVRGANSSINLIRLTKMTTPNAAYVQNDEAVKLNSTTPACYTSKVDNVVVDGTMTLALLVSVARGEAIQIGGITVDFTPQ